MKSMSKFFLIFSGALTGVGIIICVIASFMAKNQNVQLFQKKIDGKYVYTVDINDTDVTKISIDAADADITVYTGQEKDYLEFINFNDTYFSVSTRNRVVDFGEYVDLPSLFSFWDPSFQFKGMRSLLTVFKRYDGDKKINIYLSDERDIKIFDFSLEKGDITVENLSTATDYNINLDNGNIKLKDLKTTSNVKIKSNSCNLSTENCEISYFTGDIANITMTGDISEVHNFTLSSSKGNANVTLAYDSEISTTNIMTSGAVTVNGEPSQGNYTGGDEGDIPEDASSAKITGDTLNVNLIWANMSNDKKTEETQ